MAGSLLRRRLPVVCRPPAADHGTELACYAGACQRRRAFDHDGRGLLRVLVQAAGLQIGPRRAILTPSRHRLEPDRVFLRNRCRIVTGGSRLRRRPFEEVQFFPNVNATRRWGTVQNIAAANVPTASEQVNLPNVAKAAHGTVLMAGTWTNP